MVLFIFPGGFKSGMGRRLNSDDDKPPEPGQLKNKQKVKEDDKVGSTI